MIVRIKRGLKVFFGVILVLLVLGIAFVGPWPTYAARPVAETDSFQSAVHNINESIAPSSQAPEPLQAGWAKVAFDVPAATPLAGFGNRRGAPNSGVHDQVYVRALSLTDGADELVILSSDLLIVPENIAETVREHLSGDDGLGNPSTILFNATHTHGGPGAWSKGFAAGAFGGAYNPDVEVALVIAFVEAVREARANLGPASIASGGIDVPEHVRNRARDAKVDPELNYLILRRPDDEQCVVGSYTAHATMTGSDNTEFTADYPGYFVRALERDTGGFAMFLAGAVGSTSARVDGPDGFARAETLGETLAQRLLASAESAEYQETVDIAAIGAPFTPPSYQFRLNKNWRLSPFVFRLLGVDRDAWIHGARIGGVFLYATPCDISGEIALHWKAWAETQGIDLWVLSFNGDYVGYVSPDRYYDTAERGTDEEYEMYTMSWLGPYQEALFTELLHYLVPRVAGSTADE